jgi:uncharacterized membrane protein
MTATAAIAELASMLARWLHVGAAAVWLGVTIRFLLLAERLAAGREIAVAYGGDLFILRRLEPSEPMPAVLLPLRWSAYLTCLFGFLLLGLDWYRDFGVRLVAADGVLPPGGAAVAVAVLWLILGYPLYELLCPLLARLPGLVEAVAWGVVLIASGLAWFAIFEPRAALLHQGVLIATCMAANVGHHIAPYERSRLRTAAAAGPEELSRRARARARSQHNAYAMPPTLALMLLGHAPLALPPHSPTAFLAGLVLAGFALTDTLAHFRHRPRRAVASALAAAAGVVVTCLPRPQSVSAAQPPDPAEVAQIIERRCLACHAGSSAAGGLALDQAGVLAQNARAVVLAAAYGRRMPPGNVTGMTEAERERLRLWFLRSRAGAGGR